MKRIFRGLVVAAMVCAVGVESARDTHIARASTPKTLYHSCTSVQNDLSYNQTGSSLPTNVTLHLTNGCWNWGNGVVGFISNPGCSGGPVSSVGWTQGSTTHGWFHCTFDFAYAQSCSYPGSPGSTLRVNEFMDVYSSGTYQGSMDNGTCV